MKLQKVAKSGQKSGSRGTSRVLMNVGEMNPKSYKLLFP